MFENNYEVNIKTVAALEYHKEQYYFWAEGKNEN